MRWMGIVGLVGVLLGIPFLGHAQNPWVDSYGTPSRVRYVSPSGGGDGTTEAGPMTFSAAIAGAQAGDLYWLLAGTYVGTWTLAANGTSGAPIVWRAKAGQRAKIDGSVDITGNYNWIWGLEITDPNGSAAGGNSGSVYAGAPGVHIINCLLYDSWDGNGIGGWDTGADHVYYGNIVWKVGQHADAELRGYPIYTQNTFSTNGWKYIINNFFLDPEVDVGGPGYNFHAYTESGVIKGMHVEGNTFRHGRFLLGGKGIPADNHKVISNYFFENRVHIGYSRPTQVEFLNNYLGRFNFDSELFWGTGGDTYTQPGPNVYTGNEFYLPRSPGQHIKFQTAAFIGGVPTTCTPNIQSTDTWNNNTYSAPFNATLCAGGDQWIDLNLAAWRSTSASYGKQFDVNSTEVSGTPANKVVVQPNEYEPGRGHVIIYNWALNQNVTINLSSIVSTGHTYVMANPKDPFGTPLLAGTYAGGTVSVPTSGSEFLAVLVTSSSSGEGTEVALMGTVTMGSPTFLSAPTIGTVTMDTGAHLNTPTLDTVVMSMPTFLSAPTIGTVTMP